MTGVLHLRPMGGVSVRWVSAFSGHPPCDSIEFSCPDDETSFGALRCWLAHARQLVAGALSVRIEEVEERLNHMLPDSAHGAAHASVLSSGVAFAVLRRISRESVYTARVIDSAARVLLDVVHELEVQLVRVLGVTQIDRPSLKVLVRVALVADSSACQLWEWQFDSDPYEEDGSLRSRSRSELLGAVGEVLQMPRERSWRRAHPSNSNQLPPLRPTVQGLASDLVLQNYDRIFRAFERGEAGRFSAFDRARLIALSALNVGDVHFADQMLEESESMLDVATEVAHLAYLRGLIAAKRRYDLQLSDRHHQRGLKVVAGSSAMGTSLEKAWLYNGLALNAALRWRQSGTGREFDSAYELLMKSFSEASKLDCAASTYLRFNLVANTAFLLEMSGRYRDAAFAFEQAFSMDHLGQDLSAPLSYRIGVLWMRANNYPVARRFLTDALEGCAEDWALCEVVLRALAELSKMSGDVGKAASYSERGGRLCLDARARRGAMHHVSTLYGLLGLAAPTRALLAKLLQGGVAKRELMAFAPRRVPSKLPAYVPEVDLENLPAIDLNRFLGQSEGHLPHKEVV